MVKDNFTDIRIYASRVRVFSSVGKKLTKAVCGESMICLTNERVEDMIYP